MNADSRSKEGTKGKCTDWKAWHDTMPGSPQTLHVVGACEFPKAGYSVQLRPANPQGINPKIYLLNKIVTPPSGMTAQVVTVVPVHYEERTETRYDKVQINPDGTTVDVQEVS